MLQHMHLLCIVCQSLDKMTMFKLIVVLRKGLDTSYNNIRKSSPQENPLPPKKTIKQISIITHLGSELLLKFVL